MKKILFLISTVFLFFLTGCVSQLQDRLMIQGIGIDKEGDRYVVTTNVFDAENSGNGKNGKEGSGEDVNIVFSEGKSVMDAFVNLTNRTGKEPLYSQNLLLVIGEDTARDGVNSIVDFFIRHYEARPDIKIFVAEGKAKNILHAKINERSTNAKTLLKIGTSQHLNANVMGSNLAQFIGNLKSMTSESSATRLIFGSQKENKEIKAEGTAVFSGDKLKGFLDPDETKGALLINGRALGGSEVIKIKDIGNINFTFNSTKSIINVKSVDGKLKINIKIKVGASVYELDRDIRVRLGEENFKIMDQALKDRLTALAMMSIKKLIIEYKSDIFDFGKRLLKSDQDFFRKVSLDWPNTISRAEYIIDIDTDVKIVGQEISPALF